MKYAIYNLSALMYAAFSLFYMNKCYIEVTKERNYIHERFWLRYVYDRWRIAETPKWIRKYNNVMKYNITRMWLAEERHMSLDQVTQKLETGHVNSQNNRKGCMRRCMNVNETRSMCQYWVVRHSILFAYPCGQTAWQLFC